MGTWTQPYGAGTLGGIDVYEIPRKKAPHLGHSQHLCNMAERGADVELVKNLVKDAKFMCKTCGRAAAKQENLCDPIPL